MYVFMDISEVLIPMTIDTHSKFILVKSLLYQHTEGQLSSLLQVEL
jgi:hypothetical protein